MPVEGDGRSGTPVGSCRRGARSVRRQSEPLRAIEQLRLASTPAIGTLRPTPTSSSFGPAHNPGCQAVCVHQLDVLVILDPGPSHAQNGRIRRCRWWTRSGCRGRVTPVGTVHLNNVRPLNDRTNKGRLMKKNLVGQTGLWLVLLTGYLAAHPVAQDTPDFSGQWIVESVSQPAADTPRALTVSMTLVRTNVRGEPMKPLFKDITVKREFAAGTSSETYQIGIEESTVSARADGTKIPSTHSGAKWEAQALVMEKGSYTGASPETGVWTERREVWSLEPDGRLRLVVTTRASASPSNTVALVYRRQ